jgi:hypothetical protein
MDGIATGRSRRGSLTCLCLALLSALALTACAGGKSQVETGSSYLERSVTRAAGNVLVTASVLDAREIEEAFGIRLDLVGIQPVWLKIRNLSPYTYLLFLRSIDPDYFSPYEVARRAAPLSDEPLDAFYAKLRDQEIRRYITPGAEVEGYVYSHADEGLKSINVDMVGNRRLRSFNMMVEVPGLVTDYDDFDFENSGEAFFPDLEEYELRDWLTALPCCTSTAEGVLGDPLNLVIVGSIDDVRAALVSQHWDVTAEVTGASLQRLFSAFIFGSRYRYAPISNLYLFGREQDMTFQRARAVIDERNHVRLWLAPVTTQGTPVWVGHISRDAGVKFSGRFWPPTTHVIDPAVDEARFFIEQDLLYSQRVAKIGLVEGVGQVSVDAPRHNAEGDPYFTDGFRAVFFLDRKPRSIEELKVLDWALPDTLEPFRSNIFDYYDDPHQ